MRSNPRIFAAAAMGMMAGLSASPPASDGTFRAPSIPPEPPPPERRASSRTRTPHVVNAADHARMEAAAQRRAAKTARQAKGFVGASQ